MNWTPHEIHNNNLLFSEMKSKSRKLKGHNGYTIAMCVDIFISD